ncbi:MAG: hypothetical protein ACLGIC_00335 [Acidimicrobiia bacterium]
MRRLTTCFAALAFVLAGCGDDDDTTTADTTATTVSTTTTSAPTTTSTSVAPTTTEQTTTAPEGGPELAQTCTSPDGFAVSYPDDWEAVSDCGQFGPAPLDEPTPNSDDRTGVVSAFIDPVPFDQVSEPTDGDQARREATVDGRPAVRIETVVQEGLYPQGTEGVRWLVDLEDDRTLFLDAYDLGLVDDFDRAVEVLDAMAQSVDLEG